MLLSSVLVLLLILISLSLTTSPTSSAPASCTFVTSAASDPCLTFNCLHHRHLHRPFKTRLLLLPLSQSRLYPNSLQCLQLIQNSLARVVTRTPRHDHITPQSALEFCPIHCPNGRLGQDLGFGRFAFALKLPE